MPDERKPSKRTTNSPRRARPAQPNQVAQPLQQASANAQHAEDDFVPVPPPSPEDFLRRSSPKIVPRHAKKRPTTFRKTLVPLLLTHGVFLPILGGLWFATEHDSPYRQLGVAAPIILIGGGLILLLLGVSNVLQIKHIQSIKGS